MEGVIYIEQQDEAAVDPYRAVTVDDLDYESFWFDGPMTIFKGYHPRTGCITLIRIRTDLLMEALLGSVATFDPKQGRAT